MTARAIKTGNPLRVVVVDDDPALHRQVAEQLQHSGEPWHVTAYHSGAEALKGMAAAPPHVVLMDIGMPEMSGIECAHQLKLKLPTLPVVMHTARAQPELVLSALQVGARGYVVKNSARSGLVTLLNKAMNGGLALCANAESLLLQAMQRTHPTPPEWGLTQREEEVLLCLCQNGPEKDIADILEISTQTVHVHVRRIFQKLGVHDRKSAITKYLKTLPGG